MFPYHIFITYSLAYNVNFFIHLPVSLAFNFRPSTTLAGAGVDECSSVHSPSFPLSPLPQLRAKVDGIADVELHLTEVLNQYESAIIATDASSLSEASLWDPQPEFATVPGYDEVDPTPRNTPSPPQQVGDEAVKTVCFRDSM